MPVLAGTPFWSSLLSFVRDALCFASLLASWAFCVFRLCREPILCTHPRKRNLAGVVQGQNSDTKYLFHKAPRVKLSVGRTAAVKKAPATFSINNKSSKSVRQQVKDFFSKVQFSFKSRGAKSGSSSALGVRAQTGGLVSAVNGLIRMEVPITSYKMRYRYGRHEQFWFQSNKLLWQDMTHTLKKVKAPSCILLRSRKD